MARADALVVVPKNLAGAIVSGELTRDPASGVVQTATGIETDWKNITKVQDAIVRVQEYVEKISRQPTARVAFETLLYSSLIAAWTAFEALATDLWIEAVNRRPMSLGINAILAPSDVDPGNYFSLETMKRYRFGLKHRVGTMIREHEPRKFDFNRADGIRIAYQSTFGVRNKEGGWAADRKIKSVFSHSPFESVAILEAMRHVLVHRGGRIDNQFKSRVAKHPKFSDLPLRSILPVDGAMIREFSLAAFTLGTELLGAVDSWLKANRA